MTTGSIIVPFPGTIGGLGVGRYYSKVWNGTNRIGSEPQGSWHGYTVTAIEKFHKPMQYWLVNRWVNCSSAQFSTSLPAYAYYPDNEALNKLWDRAANNSWDAGTYLGELRKTGQGLADNLANLAKGYRAFRRGDVKRSLQYFGVPFGPGDLGKSWLQLQYAWMPLLKDIKGMFDYIQRDMVMIHSVTGKKKREDHYLRTSAVGASWDVIYDNRTLLHARLAEPLSIYQEVGLTDPASIAWELTAWSFVLDWALPIGNMLKALNARNTLKFAGDTVWRTHTQKQFNTQLRSVKPVGAPYYFQPQHGVFERRTFVQRMPFTNGLPLELPRFKNPFGSTEHILSAFALFHQSVLSRR